MNKSFPVYSQKVDFFEFCANLGKCIQIINRVHIMDVGDPIFS